MDLVGCCRVFVAVSTAGSFTAGAAVAAVPQSVASRRVAALEAHVGARLFDRTSRTVQLTPLGRDLLPSARRLVDVAGEFELDARRAATRPLRLALPPDLPPRAVAEAVATAARSGTPVEVVTAPPSRRVEMVSTREVRAAVVPSAAGRWRVPLGLAAVRQPPTRLGALRPRRSDAAGVVSRVLVTVEDDVEHLRQALTAASGAAGLLPAQVVVGAGRYEALAAVLDPPDAAPRFLLCSATEAAAVDLRWAPLAVPPLVRGYDLLSARPEDAARVAAAVPLGELLGGPDGGAR